MIRTIEYFKTRFVTGYVLTQEDIADWLDSFRHNLTPVPLSDTTGLEALLDAYRKKVDNIPVGEVDGLGAYISSLLANYITTGSSINQNQVVGLVEALESIVPVSDVQDMIDLAIANISFAAPEIGENGNWYVNEADTGVSATGPAGDTGPAGPAPEIGSNGNWVIDGNDTGVRASTWEKTDYNENISGSRTGGNTQFFASEHYVPGTMKVWMDGLRLSRGFAGDFTENGDHISITINRPGITMETLFIFEYQRANIGS